MDFSCFLISGWLFPMATSSSILRGAIGRWRDPKPRSAWRSVLVFPSWPSRQGPPENANCALWWLEMLINSQKIDTYYIYVQITQETHTKENQCIEIKQCMSHTWKYQLAYSFILYHIYVQICWEAFYVQIPSTMQKPLKLVVCSGLRRPWETMIGFPTTMDIHKTWKHVYMVCVPQPPPLDGIPLWWGGGV